MAARATARWDSSSTRRSPATCAWTTAFSSGSSATSRRDLVFSHTGELLGIMVNNDYCALIKDFTPLETLRTGDDTASEKTGQMLDGLAARIQSLPLNLQ